MNIDKTHEHDIESYLKKQARKNNFLCFKFRSFGYNGMPDRLLIGHGHTFFVELKAPGEKPRKLQQKRISDMRSHGAIVYVIDSKETIDEVFAKMQNSQTEVM